MTDKKAKSLKGTKLLKEIEKKGRIIDCPKCGNTSFKILGGFVDDNGNLHESPSDNTVKAFTAVMCNECLAFNVQEKLV